MRLKLSKLQESDKEAQKIRAEGLDGYEDINRVLHYQRLLYVPKAICIELISQYHNDLLVGPFGINKTKKLISRNYH